MNKNFQTYPRSRRSAFTLVELLLVIVIIAILASLGVGVMAQAQNDAAISATRSRITIIQKILEIELEDYEVKRSPVSFGVLSSLIDNSSFTDPAGRKLLHAKNLKRMLIADLIRTEMPDGSISGDQIVGRFPSQALTDHLSDFGIGVSNIGNNSFTMSAGASSFSVSTPNHVLNWREWLEGWLFANTGSSADLTQWPLINDSDPTDEFFEDAAHRSELLYQILQNIDVDGVPATEVIGTNSIADTDGNGYLEIVDAWGEPMFLQWQQEQVTPVGPPANNIWEPGTGMAGLSKEHPMVGGAFDEYCRTVLPTQIRPFLTSERLNKIDDFPADYLNAYKF